MTTDLPTELLHLIGEIPLAFCLIVCSLFPFTRTAAASTLYIDNAFNGDCFGNYNLTTRRCDGVAGTKYDTLQEAFNVLVPGDTVNVRGGTYLLTQRLTFTRPGDLNQLITIRNYGTEHPIISAEQVSTTASDEAWLIEGTTNVLFSGLEFKNWGTYEAIKVHADRVIFDNFYLHHSLSAGSNRNGFDLNGSSNVTIKNCHIAYLHGNGIYANRATNLTVEGCEIHHVGESFHNSDGINTWYTSSTIRNTRIYDVSDAGMDLSGTSNLEDITVYNSGDVGIKFWGGTHSARGLIVYHNRWDGIALDVRYYGPGHPDNEPPSVVHLSYSTLVNNKINLWVGSSQNSPNGSTLYLDHVVSAFADYEPGENARALAAHQSGTVNNCSGISTICKFVDKGNNLLHRDSIEIIVDDHLGIAYTAAQINSGIYRQVFSPTTKSLNPEFVNITSLDLNLVASSPAVDAGTVVSGFHCATAGPHPKESCREWYGCAPDLGAREYIPAQAPLCISESFPPNGFVDPLEDRNASDPSILYGIQDVFIRFSAPVRSDSGEDLTISNFNFTFFRDENGDGVLEDVTDHADLATGLAPEISLISGRSDAAPYHLQLSRLPLGAWTVIKATGVVDDNNTIISPKGDRIVLGFVPLDVNQDGEVGTEDASRWIQINNDLYLPQAPLTKLDFCNQRRDENLAPEDIVRAIQLSNGTNNSTYRAWNGFKMGPRP